MEQSEQRGVLSEHFLDIHIYMTSALKKEDMKALGLQLALELIHEKEDKDQPRSQCFSLFVIGKAILVPRALLTRGQRSATRGSGQIHIKLASDWLQRRLLF